MSIKTFIKDQSPIFDDHIKPVVDIPTHLGKNMPSELVEEIKQQAMEQYRVAKAALNESIADVALRDSGALEFAGEMSKRILTLMDVAAELGLVAIDEINANEAQLIKAGVSQEAINARAPGFLAEMKQKAVKSDLMRANLKDNAVDKGNITEGGFVGFNPLAIEHAAEGNLRERMYILYKSTYAFTGTLFTDPENVSLLNQRLKEKEIPWKLNTEIIDQLREQTQDKKNKLYAHGTYAASRVGSQKELSEESRENYTRYNTSIRAMDQTRIPLSERELLSQSGDLSRDSDQPVHWLPGESWLALSDSREHSSIQAADTTADPMLTGISGTTDTIFTMSYMMGMFDEDEHCRLKRDGMLACMGWMINARDHTAHEIQTSAKTFNIPYTAGPDSYKQIKPGDTEFLDKLKAAQLTRGFRMPDEYLSSQYVVQLIQERQQNETTKKQEAIESNKENSNPESKDMFEQQRKFKRKLTDIVDEGKTEDREVTKNFRL